ncbi:hypothetical protein GQX74_012245 [Glossina fuscipes]|uniref:Uncharacterized protein n=1 Tax=Glossina palpalis gambiensis TaxID=67801 RepID=A0A1B0B7B1_9MUSC|nr:hypothetical protein GQX74_012245 [Glossina fuscipes]
MFVELENYAIKCITLLGCSSTAPPRKLVKQTKRGFAINSTQLRYRRLTKYLCTSPERLLLLSLYTTFAKTSQIEKITLDTHTYILTDMYTRLFKLEYQGKEKKK